MRFYRCLLAVCLAFILLLPAQTVWARAGIIPANDQAKITFPENITFSVDLKSAASINQVILEYGVNQLTCGKLVSKAYPNFEPAETVKLAWTWEMKQTGSLPPGAKVWWRWSATDAAGNHLLTETRSIIWLDDEHPWQTVSAANLNLHWYQGGQSFSKDLLNTASQALVDLDKNVGLKPNGAVDLYIYASSDDLSQVVYYQPDWIGGLAYSDNNIILIGIAPSQIDWGKDAVAHELTHVLVGNYTFSCLGSLPTWLNEGLAMVGEGGLDEDARAQLDDAVTADTIFSVRALGSSFPEDSDRARLAYGQSWSVVDFMIRQYGKQKILTFLELQRDGMDTDKALIQVYGFDQDGLEDAWRAEVKAVPRPASQVTPTAVVPPTAVPTIVPIAGAAPVITLAPTVTVAPPSNVAVPMQKQSTDDIGLAMNVSILLGLLCCGAALVLIAVVVVLVLVRRKQS